MFIETNDLKYFASDLKHNDRLQNVADLFFTDYIELTNNRKVENRYITMFEIMRLENKYKCVSLLLKSNTNLTSSELCLALYKYSFKMFSSISKESSIFTE